MKNIVLVLLFVVGTLAAQPGPRNEPPKNITALPAGITGQEVRKVMSDFSSALGVHCDFCHVPAKTGRGMDFAADDKPQKGMARMMIKMVKDLNGKYFADMHDDAGKSISVACVTCHRGNTSPVMLEDKLKSTYDVAGIDSTIRTYRQLREKYYGGFTYNFKEGTLLRLADKIAEDSTKQKDALAIVKLNVELYPDFAFNYTHLGSYYEDAGNIPAAIENFQKAVDLDARNARLKEHIDMLKNKK